MHAHARIHALLLRHWAREWSSLQASLSHTTLCRRLHPYISNPAPSHIGCACATKRAPTGSSPGAAPISSAAPSVLHVSCAATQPCCCPGAHSWVALACLPALCKWACREIAPKRKVRGKVSPHARPHARTPNPHLPGSTRRQRGRVQEGRGTWPRSRSRSLGLCAASLALAVAGGRAAGARGQQ